MPLKSGIVGGLGRGAVGRGIPHREADALAVVPGSEVRRAQAEFERQALGNLPAVLTVEFDCVVRLVVEWVLVLLLVIGGPAGEQVGVGATGRAGCRRAG